MEKVILRKEYLKKVKSLIDTEFIKVITGVRRSGKSYLLMMIKYELVNRQVSDEQILYLNFENLEYFGLLSFDKLYDYLKNKFVAGKKMYFCVRNDVLRIKKSFAICPTLIFHSNGLPCGMTDAPWKPELIRWYLGRMCRAMVSCAAYST